MKTSFEYFFDEIFFYITKNFYRSLKIINNTLIACVKHAFNNKKIRIVIHFFGGKSMKYFRLDLMKSLKNRLGQAKLGWIRLGLFRLG